jgi:hypothetical protein
MQYDYNMNEKPGSTNEMPYRKPVRIFENSGTVNPEGAYYVQLEKGKTKNFFLQIPLYFPRFVVIIIRHAMRFKNGKIDRYRWFHPKA